MRVLVGCEYTAVVREAFKKKGHDAWSCDLRPTEIPGNHYQGDIFDIIDDGFDLLIGHPPCTFLVVTGNRWMKPEYKHLYPDRQKQRQEAIDFFKKMANCKIPRICLENPKGIMSTEYRKPDQMVQPWYFGDSYQKETFLWLKNLPKLVHATERNLFEDKTHVHPGEFVTIANGKRMPKWYSNSKKSRNRTFPGIANAMAEQWNF